MFFVQEKMSEVDDAYNENVVDMFVLKRPGQDNVMYSGQIFDSNKKYIYIQLFDQLKSEQRFLDKIDTKGVYELIFKVEREPYQVQHLALDFVKSHDLFRLLINNPNYERDDSGNGYSKANAGTWNGSTTRSAIVPQASNPSRNRKKNHYNTHVSFLVLCCRN